MPYKCGGNSEGPPPTLPPTSTSPGGQTEPTVEPTPKAPSEDVGPSLSSPKEQRDLEDGTDSTQKPIEDDADSPGGSGCQKFAPSVFEVCGSILKKYLDFGGSHRLGLPESPAIRLDDGIGSRQVFGVAEIYEHPTAGVNVVYREVINSVSRFGLSIADTGYPISDTKTQEGRYIQEFENQNIDLVSATRRSAAGCTSVPRTAVTLRVSGGFKDASCGVNFEAARTVPSPSTLVWGFRLQPQLISKGYPGTKMSCQGWLNKDGEPQTWYRSNKKGVLLNYVFHGSIPSNESGPTYLFSAMCGFNNKERGLTLVKYEFGYRFA